MPREWKFHIEDIVECMERAASYTKPMTFEDFEEDRMTLDAVERNFITIGEAANQVPAEVKEKYPEIPWRKIIDMRNVVVHQYFGVIPRIMWNAIHEDFPPLIPKLESILESEG